MGASSMPVPAWALGIIGVVVAVVLVLICCCCCCCKRKRKSKNKEEKRVPKQRVDLKAFKKEMIESTTQHVQPAPEQLPVSKAATLPLMGYSSSPVLTLTEYSSSTGRRYSNSPAHTPHRSLTKHHSLDYGMYRDDGSETITESSECSNVGNGKINFQLEYDFQTNDLIVSVIECKDLAAKDFGGTSDPYVKVYVLPDKRMKHQTKVHKKTLNPQFNETFVFHGMEFRSIRDRSVYFEVIDFDQFSKHDMIGVADIPLETIDLAKTTDMWQELRSPGKNVSTDLGEILFALCYLPTAGRLTTVIMKAKNLKAMDITGKSDPYAKVALLMDGKRVKKKKTAKKKHTLNPVWNESFQFDLPTEQIDQASIVISVMDYDALSRNDGIGQVEVGPRCKALGGQHWREMLASPRRQIAQWHSLVPYSKLRGK